jgi:cell division protein FtsL
LSFNVDGEGSEIMKRKFKTFGREAKILLIALAIVMTVFLSPIFLRTVTAGEIDIFQMVSTLLGKVENQDDKIAKLENEIDQLKEQIEQQKPDPIVEQKEGPVVEVKPVEVKPVEPKPVEVKPAEPKPVVTKPVEQTEPKLQVYLKESALKLIWTKDTSSNFQGYKIVISKGDTTPSYPDNGYLTYITDRYTTGIMLDNSTSYTDGDFGSVLAADTYYYFAVTYVYKDKKVTTDAVKFKTPSTFNNTSTEPLPPESLTLEVIPKDTGFKLLWTKEPSDQLQGYKVVISKNNPTPSYPDDGYLKWITDRNMNYIYVDNKTLYNGGDIDGYLEADTNYYVSITYVYNDEKITTQPVLVLTPSTLYKPGSEPTLNVENIDVNSTIYGSTVKLIWTKETNSTLQGYKVVISKNNSTPSYPEDGYLVWITDYTKNYWIIDNKNAYNSGDFGEYLEADQSYYATITYVYADKKVTSQTIVITTPPDLYIP